ncbi:MAG: ribonuclease D [Pseudomonadota bacterium]
MHTDFQFVDDTAGIAALAERLNHEQWVAVDTEFVRERTYYPQLCLIQLSTESWCSLVDPLAKADLEPLWLALYRSDLTKVFHAATQDLELLTLHRDRPPENLFDTQIAAPLIGHKDGMGYARLVEAMTGQVLPKDQTRADWTQRPLPAAALRYAANDVLYLAAIYPSIRDTLSRAGKSTWLDAEWRSLADPSRYRRDPTTVAMRLKGLDRLSPPQQARVQALAAWRERTAQALDQPRGWVVSDSALYGLARRNPDDLSALKRVRDLKASTVAQFGDAIIATLREAPERPLLPIRMPRRRTDSSARRTLLDTLSTHVSRIADEHGIDPETLASRAKLDRWLDAPAEGFDTAWRTLLLEQPLRAVLNDGVDVPGATGVASSEPR